MRRHSVKIGAVNVADITSDGEMRISAWPYYLIIFCIRDSALFSSILLRWDPRKSLSIVFLSKFL